MFVCKALLEEQARVQVYDPQVKRQQMFVEFDYTCGINKSNTPKLEESVRRRKEGNGKKMIYIFFHLMGMLSCVISHIITLSGTAQFAVKTSCQSR